MRVREREGYPLHCCVTGNLIAKEGGREAGRGWERRERGRSGAMQKHRARLLLLGLQRRGTLLDPHCTVRWGGEVSDNTVHKV